MNDEKIVNAGIAANFFAESIFWLCPFDTRQYVPMS